VSLCAFDADRIVLRYVLEGDLEYLIIPSEDAARRAHELWLHTCFEAFLGAVGSPGYCELNFAPSRAWANVPLQRAPAGHGGRYRCTRSTPRDAAHGPREITLEATVFWRDLIPQIPPRGCASPWLQSWKMRVVGSRIGPFGIRREGPISTTRRFHPRA